MPPTALRRQAEVEAVEGVAAEAEVAGVEVAAPT
jgi:hypothetical protein